MDCGNTIILKNTGEIQRIPLMGTFELTVRCNLKCKMCLFRHADSENPSLLKEELSAAEWIDMARQAAEAGTIELLITGGEAMLRQDFCEIWEGIYQYGFIITLYTNASMVTPKIMETLRKCPPHKIGITLYGVSPETYEKVTGNGEAFQKVVKGIHELLTLPSAIEFRATIIKDSFSDALLIDRFVHQEFGYKDSVVQTRIVTKAVRGACADVESCRLDPADNVLLSFQRGVEDIKAIVGDSFDPSHLSIEMKDLSDDSVFAPKVTLFGCNAGMTQYTISYDGKLLGCQMLGVFYEDAKNKGLQEAWNHFPAVVKLPPVQEQCMTCEYAHLCNTCYASRYAETGDLSGIPRYVCEDTKILFDLINQGGKIHERKDL